MSGRQAYTEAKNGNEDDPAADSEQTAEGAGQKSADQNSRNRDHRLCHDLSEAGQDRRKEPPDPLLGRTSARGGVLVVRHPRAGTSDGLPFNSALLDGGYPAVGAHRERIPSGGRILGFHGDAN